MYTFIPCGRVCAQRGLEFTDNILEVSYPAIGANIIVMALEGVVFFVLTLLLEQSFFMHKLASCFIRRKIESAAVHPDEVRSNCVITLSQCVLVSGACMCVYMHGFVRSGM